MLLRVSGTLVTNITVTVASDEYPFLDFASLPKSRVWTEDFHMQNLSIKQLQKRKIGFWSFSKFFEFQKCFSGKKSSFQKRLMSFSDLIVYKDFEFKAFKGSLNIDLK